MKVLSIVGARPQFIKVAVICAVVEQAGGIEHRIIHTGQHYDAEMSDVFFEDLQIRPPDYDLGVGSGAHGEQTGEMMKRLEPVLTAERPDWVLLYGDTNSTLAGALVASKLGQRLGHVEAGLRSHNRKMAEELNRIVADHLSDVLLCPTPVAVDNLKREGLGMRAVLTGDVMLDAALIFRQAAEGRGGQLADHWARGKFALATIHRAENTDDARRLGNIFEALEEVAATVCPVVIPLHPRTRKCLAAIGWSPRAVSVIPPCSYLEMLLLESRARFILTDSGGVQKEAYFVKVPCITLRDETEWTETLENRCNVLVGTDPEKILCAAASSAKAGPWVAAYGQGDAGLRILDALKTHA